MGALVYSAEHRGWIYSAHAKQVSFPALDGKLRIDDESLAVAGDDFGHLIEARPIAILEPATVEDILRVIGFAIDNGIALGARGQGHTAYGQSQVRAGILINMRGLLTPPEFGEGWLKVSAGYTWREVLKIALERGLTPPVLTHNPGLSVGGTLSVGGLDAGSHRYGAQIDNVLELEIVTGEGRLEVCSSAEKPDLFNAILGGQGQCGIIVRAKLKLIPAPFFGRRYRFFYPDLNALLEDMARLLEDRRFSRFVAEIVPSPIGGWIYFIEAVLFFSPDLEPDESSLLSGLQYSSRMEQAPVTSYLDIVDRVPLLQALETSGRINLPHPWFDMFLPGATIGQFSSEVFKSMTREDLGEDFPVTISAHDTSLFRHPLLRSPDGPSAYLFDLQRTAPDKVKGASMVEKNKELYSYAKDLGGSLYPIGAVPLSKADWQSHYGQAWEKFCVAKKKYDPAGILAPGPGIF